MFTTLDLCSNQIGDQEVQHLTNVLQQNKVTRRVPVLLFDYSLSFPTDTYDIEAPYV